MNGVGYRERVIKGPSSCVGLVKETNVRGTRAENLRGSDRLWPVVMHEGPTKWLSQDLGAMCRHSVMHGTRIAEGDSHPTTLGAVISLHPGQTCRGGCAVFPCGTIGFMLYSPSPFIDIDLMPLRQRLVDSQITVEGWLFVNMTPADQA